MIQFNLKSLHTCALSVAHGGHGIHGVVASDPGHCTGACLA